MNGKLKYQVEYIAEDGTIQGFTFKTTRSFREYFQNDYGAKMLGRPFLNEMLEAAKRIGAKPESNMSKHGGFMYTKIRRIKCVETGETKFFRSAW